MMKERVYFHNYERHYNNLLRRLRESTTISQHNREILLRLNDALIGKGLSYPRILRFLGQMVMMAQILNKELDEATRQDIEALVVKIHERPNLSERTKVDYKGSLKQFYKWLKGNDEDYPPEVRWIKRRLSRRNHKLPEDMLVEEEIKKVIDACDHPRDRAICSLLWETGARIGEIGTAKIKSLSFNGTEGEIMLDGKTGMRKVLLIGSVPHLKQWLSVHPQRNNREDYLFVLTGNTNKGMPLTYASVTKMLRVIMQRAGIQKRYNPHLWRHSRATYLAGYLTEAQLCNVMGWVPGSKEAGTYVHLSHRDVSDSIRKIYGMGKTQKEQESILKPTKCNICNEVNEAGLEICNRCGNPLTLEAAIKRRQPDEERKVEDTLKDLFWDKFKDKILPQISPEQAKELFEEAEKISKNSQLKAVSVS